MSKDELFMECQMCSSWSKFCIEPPIMTEDDITSMVEDAAKEDITAGIMAVITYAGRSTLGTQCPVFSERLRNDKAIIESIKNVMRGNEL
jgi:acetaldehyde dehydrogenase (acetylating)